jgi:hypothetical protein
MLAAVQHLNDFFSGKRGLGKRCGCTGPALFRSIVKWCPTFVIDEADTAL